MALTTEQLLALNDRISNVLERYLEPLFKRGTHLTFIARTPGNNEADVLVTSEGDLNDVADLIERSMSRNIVGHGSAAPAGVKESSNG
jgi:hypothetical protein